MINTPDVSIIIVCMNKIDNILPCLKSIVENTSCSYEILVVAYLFSKDNLIRLKNEYPEISIIESNEIRGFSENNNLALKKAKGEYCFVLNDDTILRPKCIDNLVLAIKDLPDNVTVVSPNIFDAKGKLSVSGRKRSTLFTYILQRLHLSRFFGEKWINGKGRFKTHDILGAAFLIKKDEFEKIGWFDERYFFAPEDSDLSRKINRAGHECWVETSAELIHMEGMTSGKSISMVKTATAPAQKKGLLIYYSDDSWYKKLYVWPTLLFFNIIQFVAQSFKYALIRSTNNRILVKSCKNSFSAFFTNYTPKQLFILFLEKLK